MRASNALMWLPHNHPLLNGLLEQKVEFSITDGGIAGLLWVQDNGRFARHRIHPAQGGSTKKSARATLGAPYPFCHGAVSARERCGMHP